MEGVIEIHENAIPRIIDGVAVLSGALDGQRVYVARSGTNHGWGLTPGEAIQAMHG